MEVQLKICLLGAFAVGKTSLVKRFVHSIFSEKYLTTIGVKIDKKVIELGRTTLNCILWDLHGESEFQQVRSTYLRGAAGYLLVLDGTRPETVDIAADLRRRAVDTLGDVPFVVLLNKADLRPQWALAPTTLTELSQRGWPLIETSAKTGERVEEAFAELARLILEKRSHES